MKGPADSLLSELEWNPGLRREVILDIQHHEALLNLTRINRRFLHLSRRLLALLGFATLLALLPFTRDASGVIVFLLFRPFFLQDKSLLEFVWLWRDRVAAQKGVKQWEQLIEDYRRSLAIQRDHAERSNVPTEPRSA